MSKVIPGIISLYKEAYTGHPKEIWHLVILTLINRMGTMVLPFMSVYLTTVLDYSLNQAGILVGTYGVGSFLGAWLAGKYTDRFGPELIIKISLLCGGIMFFSLQFVTAFVPLLILVFITSIFGETYRPAMMAAVGKYGPAGETTRSMAMLRLAISLGMSLAPTIGGFVAANLGYNWLFVVDGCTYVAAGIFFTFASRSWTAQNSGDENSPGEIVKEQGMLPQHNRQYLFFLLGTFLLGLGFVQWFHTVPVFIKQEWGYDERYIGTMMGIHSLIIVLFEMPLIQWVQSKSLVDKASRIGLFTFAICFLPFLMPPSLVWYAVAMLCWTVGSMLFLPVNNAHTIVASPPDRRGAYTSWYWMCWSTVAVVGPLTGLFLADKAGFTTLWVVITLVVLSSFTAVFSGRVVAES